MRILWLKTELLHPLDKGGRIRTFAMLRELCRHHEVTYLTLDDETGGIEARERAAEYCQRLVTVPFTPARRRSPRFWAELARNVGSALPYAVAKYRSRAMQAAVRECAAAEHDILVCDFLFPAINVPSGLSLPTVLFAHNVEAEIWERHASVARDPLRRAYLAAQARRMKEWEGRQCRQFDHVIAVSDSDRDLLASRYGIGSVSSVPTGVDAAYFTATGREPRRPFEIVFTGSMDWMPNEDGIEWFCEAVLPIVRARVPEAVVTVVGRHPGPRVQALARRYEGVTVTGTVPDVRPYLERCAVLIVPLRVGGGTRLKIYEGMSMGRPTVATTIGAEGLPLASGDELLIADDPEALAGAVTRLLLDPEAAEAMGRRAAARVRRDFSWQNVTRVFADICHRVAEDVTSRRQGLVAEGRRAP